MSRLTRSGAICCAVLMACFWTPILSSGQDVVPTSQATILTYAHDLLKIFYPEFFGKTFRLSLSVTTPADNDWLELGGVYFVITPEDVNPLPMLASSDPQAINHILLGGSIWLPPRAYGRVMEIRILSDPKHEREVEKLSQLAKSHSEWSETQVASALRQAGAQFGPADKDAFVSSLPLSEAERFLGHLTLTAVGFNYPGRTGADHQEASALGWTVQANATLPDGTRALRLGV